MKAIIELDKGRKVETELTTKLTKKAVEARLKRMYPKAKTIYLI